MKKYLLSFLLIFSFSVPLYAASVASICEQKEITNNFRYRVTQSPGGSYGVLPEKTDCCFSAFSAQMSKVSSAVKTKMTSAYTTVSGWFQTAYQKLTDEWNSLGSAFRRSTQRKENEEKMQEVINAEETPVSVPSLTVEIPEASNTL